MGDTWEYNLLWEYAGLTPPKFHEDELQKIMEIIGVIIDGIYAGAGPVTTELKKLQSAGISSQAFDALYQRWHGPGVQAVNDIANTLSGLRQGLQKVLTLIYEWKADLTATVGLADMGLTVLYVGTGGIAALADRVGGRVAAAELQRRLEHLVDDLEGKVISLVIDGTPLRDLKRRVADELQKLITESIEDAGVTAGSYVRDHS